MKRTIILANLVLVCFGVWTLNFSNVWAAFSAEALSAKNVIRGGSIELMVIPDVGNSISEQVLHVGKSIHFGFRVLNQGKNSFRYSIDLPQKNISSCNIYSLQVQRDKVMIYSGALENFEYVSNEALLSEEKIDWNFEFWIPDGTVIEDSIAVCPVSFMLDAWQAMYEIPTSGWTDMRVLPGFEVSPLNEVVPSLLISDESAILHKEASDENKEDLPIIEIERTFEDGIQSDQENFPEADITLVDPPIIESTTLLIQQDEPVQNEISPVAEDKIKAEENKLILNAPLAE